MDTRGCRRTITTAVIRKAFHRVGARVASLAAPFTRCVERASSHPARIAPAARECIAVGDGWQLQWVLGDGAADLVAGIRAHARRIAETVSAHSVP